MVRELKEGFLGWLSGQLLPPFPIIADYDRLVQRWIREVVLVRRHRTTQRVVGEAWRDERSRLREIPERVRLKYATATTVGLPSSPTAVEQRALGEVVQLRDLREYEAMAR